MNNQTVTIDSHTVLITEEDTGRVSFQYLADFAVEGFDVLEIGFVSEATMYGFAAYTLMPPFENITGFDFIGEYTDPNCAIQRVLVKLKALNETGLLPFHKESFWRTRAAKFVDTQDIKLEITVANND